MMTTNKNDWATMRSLFNFWSIKFDDEVLLLPWNDQEECS